MMGTITSNEHSNFTLQYPALLAPLSRSDGEADIQRKLRIVATYIDILVARRVWNWKTSTATASAAFCFCRRASTPESGLPFRPHPEFKKADLEARSELYRQIAERIWDPSELLREVNG